MAKEFGNTSDLFFDLDRMHRHYPYLVIKLMEECAEVIQVCSKLINGIDGSGSLLEDLERIVTGVRDAEIAEYRERLHEELADVQNTVNLLSVFGLIDDDLLKEWRFRKQYKRVADAHEMETKMSEEAERK